jgi:tripartite-type tricarboxylate transporter receptor subunit TctC
VQTWYGLFAPAATPAAVVMKLNADINALLQQPEVSVALTRQGMNVVGGSSERFGAMVKQELARWARVVTAAKIKAN